jgi:hypothetical protein
MENFHGKAQEHEVLLSIMRAIFLDENQEELC